ncbi:DEAD/DEAH box helicase [Kushneria aurantia]|uniref:DEAD/DEAH box helicase n=1 Tax=Kushneria aurantia TaxID=504092 RepID=A0ABV6G7E9_9GAMM|nr:AAA domain-containing protein [Kushneria aurantia]
MDKLTQIREAIRVEESAQRSTYIFKVARARHISGRIAVVKVTPDDDRRNSDTLSENLEGANAWWPMEGPHNGEARVLSVFPEDNELHITAVRGDLTDEESRLRIYPPNFIEPVRLLYYDQRYQELGLRILRSLDSRPPQDERSLPNPAPLTLRAQQREALKLPYRSHSLLIGPPGTGKTYTLAAILAQFLWHEPEQRVLLISNSNAAVDDALVKVDEALEKLGDGQRKSRSVRIGKNFTMARYEGREHLLPSSQELTDKLKTLEKRKPEQRDAVGYDSWLNQYENVRKEIDDHTKALMQKRQLVATTAASASFRFEALYSRFDLVVFDEASQVSQYQTIALLPLGRRYLFCGDDRQLPPVCVAHQNTQAQRWVGKSIFSLRDKFPNSSQVMLDEQDRMVEEICRLVSDQFYPGKLKLSASAEEENWKSERRRLSKKFRNPVEVVFVDDTAKWRQRFMGEVREGSAEKAIEIYQALSSEREQLESDIMILAPLHSQLRLIRQKAKNSKITNIPCSTIHKAQGQQYHTVVLDVINLSGKNRFLTEILSKELINVAFSRAKARLIVLAHESDLNCRYIKAAHDVAKLQRSQPAEKDSEAIDIGEYTPIGEHNITQIKGKLFRLTLKNGSQIIIEPTGIRDRYLKAIRQPDGKETEYALQIINGR